MFPLQPISTKTDVSEIAQVFHYHSHNKKSVNKILVLNLTLGIREERGFRNTINPTLSSF